MKKLFCIFVFALTAGPLLAAASTCETRVDGDPTATTAQRIEHCLTDEPDPAAPPATEVLLTDTYSVVQPSPQRQASSSTITSQVYTPAAISMEYIERDDYPAFRNDIFPSLSEEEAHETALAALGSSHDPAVNTGKKSLRKPAREMKAAPPAVSPDTAAAAYTAPVSYTEPAYAPSYSQPAAQSYTAGGSYTAPAYGQSYTQQPGTQQIYTQPAGQAPSAEVQQAQTLQNDPQQSTTFGGDTPVGFNQGIGTDNFGYNATDPAFQP